MNDLWQHTLIATFCVFVVALIGAVATDLGPWYRALKQPWFKPPDWAFGPAWTIIFAFTAAAGVVAWREAADESARLLVIAAFALNAVLNIAWSLIYFRLKRPDWAFVEVIFLWLSIVLMIVVVKPYSLTAAWLLLPYLLWVIFAATLNWATVQLNKPFNP